MMLLLLFVWSAFARPQLLEGRVVAVPDASSLIVVDSAKIKHNIKLAGIVTLVPRHKLHPTAQRLLARHTLRKVVSVEWEQTEGDKKLGKVMVGKLDVNREMIARGFAMPDPKFHEFLSTPDRTLYLEAEEKAKKFRRGVWAKQK